MQSLALGDMDGAAATFNMPPTFTRQDADEERRVLRDMLQVIRSDFGAIQDARRSTSTFRTYEVAVGSGDLEYQRSLRDVSRYTYDVHFARAGRGVVTVDVISTNGVTRPQQVHFGVRTDEPNALQIVSMTAEKEIRVVQSHHAR
jgi:imidazole glycerol phosphate synthase subunit HisF